MSEDKVKSTSAGKVYLITVKTRTDKCWGCDDGDKCHYYLGHAETEIYLYNDEYLAHIKYYDLLKEQCQGYVNCCNEEMQYNDEWMERIVNWLDNPDYSNLPDLYISDKYYGKRINFIICTLEQW